MNRPSRPDVLDLQLYRASTSTRARSRSIGSVDKPLSSNGSSVHTLTNPQLTNVSPEPAYIAASAATGIVTGNHEDFIQDEACAGHSTPTIPVTPASLKLINQFLDFLLYSFLSAAKSTTLRALRPAVSEVLRSRLAKEAVAGADHELSSYLGDDGDDDFDGLNEVQENSADWDLDATWKRTRLRCMVYSSLGDIEEDDEEVYSGYGNLEGIVGSQQYEQNSMIPGVVSPAVAIWLTSVLEFMGEQTLLLAGHAAINRFTQRMATAEKEDNLTDSKNVVERERPMVEELDTEKVALNSSLGRLWRQWRKRVRGRGSSFSMPGHHGVILQRLERTASRMSSSSTLAEPKNQQVEISEPAEVEKVVITTDKGFVLNSEEATSVIDEEFVDTIASPSKLYVDCGYLAPEDNRKRRPQSLILLPWTTTEAPFIWRPSSLRRPRSLPDITRSDFPDPIIEGVAVTDFQGVESDDIDPEFFTPTEEGPNTFPMVPENLDLLKWPVPPTQDRSGELAVDKVCEGDDEVGTVASQNLSEAENPGAVSTPDENVVEPSPCGDHTASQPSSLHNLDENDENARQALDQEPHVVPVLRTADQPKYERFPQLSPRRPAELVEIRTNGRVSTFQEQRAADRRPSATTLTELLDNAVSDDDSSIATSQREFRGGRLTPGGTNHIGADYFAHSKQASSASSKFSQHSHLSDRKLGQLTLIQPPGSTTSLPIDRGSGMRSWTPPQTPNKSRRSSSFGKIQRPVTAHSGTSQSSTKLKSLILWPMENGKQTKVSESDDDSRSSLHSDRPSMKLASLDDKERSFEELISSGDTIHCTITPDPLRRMETKEVPRTATSALADFLRNTGPDGKELRAAPPSRSGGSRPSTARAIPIIPKDPSAEDVASLVHLLRSTSGSLAGTRPQTPTTPIPSSHLSAHSPSTQRNLGVGSASPMPSSFGPMPLSPGGITGIPTVLRQKRSNSHGSHGMNRLVARDASGFTTSDSTSALADFFRNTTPPIDADGQATQRRISRSVAPFRNTMDSDQFELPEGPESPPERVVNNNEAPPNELTFLTSVVPPLDSYQSSFSTSVVPPLDSYQSSFSSSTALLHSSSKKQHDYGAVSAIPETKRKQSRVKDPYAIDIDDFDDDEDMEALSLIIPKKRRDEESLMDFLRNVPPPPQPPAPPGETDTAKTVQKKNSSVSLISRFGRSSRKNSIASNADKFPLPPVPQMPGGYKHTPLAQEDDYPLRHIQGGEQRRAGFNSRMDMDAASTTSSARFGNRPTQARGVVQARGARVDRDNTDSLADFLKFSEPPTVTRAPTPREDNSAMSKFKNFSFSRKSKRNEVF